MSTVQRLLNHPYTQTALIALIIINAIVLGMETSASIMAFYGPTLIMIDKIILKIFVVELLLKILVMRGNFFKDGWNVFDFIVIAIALIPASGSLSVLRAFRVMRVLRLISSIESMRKVAGGLFRAIPGIMSIGVIMCLIYYVYAVMAAKLYGASFPLLFGSLGTSMLTLFQIMTLDNWTTDVVKPVMAVYPNSWVFFVLFVLSATFTILNLFIGVMVNSMQSTADQDNKKLYPLSYLPPHLLRDTRGRLQPRMVDHRGRVRMMRSMS